MGAVNENREYTFCRNRSELLFVNYFDKVSISVLAVMTMIFVLFGPRYAVRGSIFGIIVIIPFLMLFVNHHGKFAHKITVDRRSGEISFHMFRNRGVILRNITDIEKVHDGSYLTFFLKEGKKVMWNKQSDELVDFLRNVTKVESK
jgi:hypothetical protein